MALGMEVGLGPCHILLDGDPALLPKKGQSPQFLAHVYCVPTAAWIKMLLGTKLGLGPGDIVLDGTQLPFPKTPPQKGDKASLPFSAHFIVAKRLDASRCHLLCR